MGVVVDEDVVVEKDPCRVVADLAHYRLHRHRHSVQDGAAALRRGVGKMQDLRGAQKNSRFIASFDQGLKEVEVVKFRHGGTPF